MYFVKCVNGRTGDGDVLMVGRRVEKCGPMVCPFEAEKVRKKRSAGYRLPPVGKFVCEIPEPRGRAVLGVVVHNKGHNEKLNRKEECQDGKTGPEMLRP